MKKLLTFIVVLIAFSASAQQNQPSDKIYFDGNRTLHINQNPPGQNLHLNANTDGIIGSYQIGGDVMLTDVRNRAHIMLSDATAEEGDTPMRQVTIQAWKASAREVGSEITIPDPGLGLQSAYTLTSSHDRLRFHMNVNDLSAYDVVWINLVPAEPVTPAQITGYCRIDENGFFTFTPSHRGLYVLSYNYRGIVRDGDEVRTISGVQQPIVNIIKP